MASFNAEETSIENSQPFECYKFLLGTDIFLFTTSSKEETVDGDTYVPTEIRRGNITQGKTERTKILQVEIAATNALAQRYVGPPPGDRATLSIFRVQRDDVSQTPQLQYSGTVKAVTFPKNGQFASMQVQTVEASSSRAIPRFTYMSMCNHILFDDGCKVDPASFQYTGPVVSVADNVLEIGGLNLSSLSVVGGYVDSSTGLEKRQILAQSGDDITVLLPFEVDPVGTNVTVFAGCNKIVHEDCTDVFSNTLEFGGFAFVPNRNIFASGL